MSPLKKRLLDAMCYLVPLSLLAVFYAPIGDSQDIFWRNWFRAACGPAAPVMGWAGHGVYGRLCRTVTSHEVPP